MFGNKVTNDWANPEPQNTIGTIGAIGGNSENGVTESYFDEDFTPDLVYQFKQEKQDIAAKLRRALISRTSEFIDTKGIPRKHVKDVLDQLFARSPKWHSYVAYLDNVPNGPMVNTGIKVSFNFKE